MNRLFQILLCLGVFVELPDNLVELEPDEAGSVLVDEPSRPEIEPVNEIEISSTDGTGQFGIPIHIDSAYVIIGKILFTEVSIPQSQSSELTGESPDHHQQV